MRNKMLNKLKEKKAFTLMETLIVLGIFCILVGISVSSVIQTQSSSNSVELDSYARKIFMEAQDKFQAMRVEGSLETLKNKSSAISQSDEPADFNPKGSYQDKALYYIAKNEAMTNFGIASIQDGDDYAIEYNPTTGEVYAVFYWLNGSPNYSQVDSSENNYRLSKKNRAAAKVGYYGGGSIDTEKIEPLEALIKNVELVNSEELYLKITFDETINLDTDRNNWNIKCTIKDQSGRNPIICEIKDGNNKGIIEKKDDNGAIIGRVEIPVFWESSNEQDECLVLLDSMQTDFDFKTLTGNTLVPGDNLTIEVNSTYKTDKYYFADTDTVKGNSLFANRADDGSVIEINTLRHLRNLDASYYNNSADKVTINQTGDIDFNNNDYAWNYSGSIASYAGVRSGTKPDNVSSGFKPISNTTLHGKTAAEQDRSVVDGQGKRLQNFVINGSGIFETAANTDFINIRIEDIKVTCETEGEKAVGTLAGSVTGGTIENCGVYLTTYTQNGDNKEYYACISDGSTNQMEIRYVDLCVKGSEDNIIGGLIGSTNGTTIKNSFAAIKIGVVPNKTPDIRGGLIGQVTGGEISNCYASGDITNNQVIAGGLIGKAEGVTIKESYSTSNIGESGIEYGKVGGFVGLSDGSNYTNCIAYGEVPHKASLFYCGGFVGYEENNNSTYTNCSYLKQVGYNSGHKDLPVAPASYSTLTSATGTLGLGASYPYDSAFYENGGLRAGFPFKAVTTSHYGNWPVERIIDVPILVYYEKYANDVYGLYAETKLSKAADGTAWVINSLRNDECIEDGYALLSKYNLNKFSYQFNDLESITVEGTNVVKVTAPTGTSFNDVNGVNNSEQLYFYKLPYNLQLPENEGRSRFYDKLSINNIYAEGSTTPVLGKKVNFYYSPYFAKTAVNPNSLTGADNITTTEPTGNPENVFIRSARQLNALGRNSYFWDIKKENNQNVNFVQEKDINFGTYVNSYCGNAFNVYDSNTSIGNTAKAFSCNYEGNNLSLKNANYTMFGNNAGLIQNCNVENVTINQTSGTVAGFASINAGTIQNCNIKNIQISQLSGIASGFAGTNTGTIINCRIYGTQGNADERCAAATIAGNEAYGFAVNNTGTINKCFITGNVNGLYVAQNGVQAEKGAMAAGFVGKNTGTITQSYANCNVSVTGNESNSGTVEGHAAGFVCESTRGISECYSVGNVRTATSSDTKIYVYGFANTVIDSNKCYSISRVIGTNADQSFAFASSMSGLTECYWGYDRGSQLNTQFNRGESIAKSLTELDAFDKYGTSGEVDVPYTVIEGQDSYPYPSVAVPHYGDWPVIVPYTEPEVPEGTVEAETGLPPTPSGIFNQYDPSKHYMGVFYYEKYNDNQYGIYTVGSTMSMENSNRIYCNDSTKYTGSDIKITTTLDTTKTVVESGYGVFYSNTYAGLDLIYADWRQIERYPATDMGIPNSAYTYCILADASGVQDNYTVDISNMFIFNSNTYTIYPSHIPGRNN